MFGMAIPSEGSRNDAGADEHSQLFFLRPDLLAADYREAPSLTAGNCADPVRIAKAEGWPGYFGAPRFASAATGAREFERSS